MISKDMVDYLISVKEVINYNRAMAFAAENNHQDMVDYMISKGANDYNMAVIYAAKNNHQDMVDYLITKCANNYDAATNRV